MKKPKKKILVRLPKTLKIGCYTYEVKENKTLEAIGETDTDRLRIEINPLYPIQVQRDTLLHECLHAILNDTFVIESHDEEKIIRVVSPKLLQLLGDNPELRSFLFD